MVSLLKPALGVLGGATLFAGAFTLSALQRGASRSDLPLIGGLLPETAEEAQGDEHVEPAAAVSEQPEPPRTAGLGLLDAFRIEGPLSAGELEQLARDLKLGIAQIARRGEELDQREQRLSDREHQLDDHYRSLQELRTSLERWEQELAVREADLGQGEVEQAEREAQSWQRMAKLFEKGDAATLARKLSAYTPGEAAQILRHLKTERARELLEGVTGESWKQYWDAYRQALGSTQP